MGSIAKSSRLRLLGAAAVPVALLAVVACHTESYCFLWPSIDTVYAAGYSETGFAKLREGMSMAEVNAIMCPPLASQRGRDGSVRLDYTRDGGAPFGDFAWFGRSVHFRNGTVVSIVKTTYHD